MRRARDRLSQWLGVYPPGKEWRFGVANRCENPTATTGYIFKSMQEVSRAVPEFRAAHGGAVVIVQMPAPYRAKQVRNAMKRHPIPSNRTERVAEWRRDERRVRSRLRPKPCKKS